MGVVAHFFFRRNRRGDREEVDVGQRDDVTALAEPLAATAELDLVEVELKGSGTRTLLRVAIDRLGGVDLATCQRFSRQLSEALDAAEAARSLRLPDGYRLEVTSPGTDHPLRDRRAFERVEGRKVLVHRSVSGSPGERTEQVEGTVQAADEDGVEIATGEGTVRVAYGEIVKATQRLPW